jgi:hypothetical protein
MFFVVLMPLLWMVVLGLAFSGDNKDKFGVGMLDTEMASPKNIYIRDLLTKDETIRLRVGSEVEQDRWLKRGEIVLPSPHLLYIWQHQCLSHANLHGLCKYLTILDHTTRYQS